MVATQQFPRMRGFGPRKNQKVVNDVAQVVQDISKGQSGVATIAAGATTAVVTHGYGSAPNPQDIQVSPTTTWGSTTKWWVNTITATQFTINADIAPGGAGLTFSWQVLKL